MHFVRLDSRLPSPALFPLLDDEIAAVDRDVRRVEERAEIEKLIREVDAELAKERRNGAEPAAVRPMRRPDRAARRTGEGYTSSSEAA